MDIWDTSLSSSQSASFPIKIVILWANNLSLSLLPCCVVSRVSLGSRTCPMPGLSSRWWSRRMRAHPLLTKTPKSQLTAEQPSTKKCWNLPKKATLHPKTKRRPQWDSRRGTIMINSNLVSTRWATHKLENNYTRDIIPQEWKFWAQLQAPQPGSLAMGGGVPRESSFAG